MMIIMENEMEYIYYTDGACSHNPGRGGYAWIRVLNNEVVSQNGGYENNTTNQRMELMAIYNALMNWWKAIGKPALDSVGLKNVTIYSDSAYAVNCFKAQWWKAWVDNGWVNSKKQPVANKDLWEKLIPFFKSPYVNLVKVKGHSSKDDFNDIVDKLAVSYKAG